MKTLAELNDSQYMRDSHEWSGTYVLKYAYVIGRYGHSGSHSHLVRIETAVSELVEHRPRTIGVGQVFSSYSLCNKQRGQHGATPILDSRWDTKDITCAKCKKMLGA